MSRHNLRNTIPSYDLARVETSCTEKDQGKKRKEKEKKRKKDKIKKKSNPNKRMKRNGHRSRSMGQPVAIKISWLPE